VWGERLRDGIFEVTITLSKKKINRKRKEKKIGERKA
jgi:hypothetical protein